MTSDPLTVLSTLKEMFKAPVLDKVAGGAPPRTSITDALVKTFIAMLKVIRPALVLEIGAHDASFSCAVKGFLTESRVIAFEANPYVFSIFSETARLKTSGVEYILSAVSHTDGEVELIIPTSVAGTKKPLHNMMGSLNRLGIPNIEDETVLVRSVTLDNFLGDIGSQSLAIWIDVEGAVDRVLAGAESTMPKAEAVICEVEPSRLWKGQATDSEILARLREWDLVPVLCDCQKKFQYNLILLKSQLIERPQIQRLITAFPAEAAHLMQGAG